MDYNSLPITKVHKFKINVKQFAPPALIYILSTKLKIQEWSILYVSYM